MPTRNSLSLISLGTPTSMGLTPNRAENQLEQVIAGNSPSGHSLWLFTFLSVISANLPRRPTSRESARNFERGAHEFEHTTPQSVVLRGGRGCVGSGIGERRNSR